MSKAKTRQEIASEYGISRRTLLRWMKRKNIDISNGLVTPGDQRKIYSTFGLPKGDRTKRKKSRT